MQTHSTLINDIASGIGSVLSRPNSLFASPFVLPSARYSVRPSVGMDLQTDERDIKYQLHYRQQTAYSHSARPEPASGFGHSIQKHGSRNSGEGNGNGNDDDFYLLVHSFGGLGLIIWNGMEWVGLGWVGRWTREPFFCLFFFCLVGVSLLFWL